MFRADQDLPAPDLESLARLCVRHPDSAYPDLLAELATGGRVARADQLLQEVRSGGTIPVSDSTALCWFALVRASLGGATEQTLTDVTALLEQAHHGAGRRGMPPRFTSLWLDALFLLGRSTEFPLPRDEAAEPGVLQWRVRVDERNPYLTPRAAPADDVSDLTAVASSWAAAFSEIFTAHGLPGVQVAAGAGHPLARLRAVGATAGSMAPAVSEATAEGGAGQSHDSPTPLVSVVIPVHNPGPDIHFSLGSVLEQTWANLEVLLCDDGSDPAHQQALVELAASDPRVRVLRLDPNQGAYAARNLGLAQARGEFVTFQDADDWAHPERIQRQVDPLLQDPSCVATQGRTIRVDPQLGVTVLGYPATTFAPVLFRREPVLHRLGGFDTVRRAADNEFHGRVAAAFGPGSFRHLPEFVGLTQRTPGSLSRDDMRLLFKHPARQHYRFCYRQWHTLIQSGRESPRIDPPQRPPVPALPRVSGEPAPAEHRADIVLLGGFVPRSPTAPDLAGEVAALCDAVAPDQLGVPTGRVGDSGGRVGDPGGRGGESEGRVGVPAGRVGLIELPSPADLAVPWRRPDDDTVQLIRTRADWILAGEPVRAGLAVVRDPASVRYLPHALQRLTADTVLLVAGEDPGARYDPAAVEAALPAGTSLRWLPATPSIARALSDRVAADHVLDPAPWGAVRPPERARWSREPEPLVGMLRPARSVPPEVLTPWAAATLPADPETPVWCRPGGPRLAARLGRPVTVIRPGEMTEEAFLDRVPYLTVPPVPGRGPHLHTGAVRGLTRGCVLFLDPAHRELFGPAALYTDERSVDEWLRLHRQEPELYRAQQDRAAAFLADTLSPQALRTTVQHVLDAAT